MGGRGSAPAGGGAPAPAGTASPGCPAVAVATGRPVPSTVRRAASVSLVRRPAHTDPRRPQPGRRRSPARSASGSSMVARSASMRKNSPPPASRAASTASCSGVMVISAGAGSSSGAVSAGASASQPSSPRSAPGPEPGDLARGRQLVEHGGVVVRHPAEAASVAPTPTPAWARPPAGRSPRHRVRAGPRRPTAARAGRPPGRRGWPTCCQAGRKRARAAVGTGSTCARSAASDRRRRIRSTSRRTMVTGAAPAGTRPGHPPVGGQPAQQSRRPRTPGRTGPRASAVVNGAWVRAYRPSSSPSGSVTVSVKLPARPRHGTPTRRAAGRCPRSPPTNSVRRMELQRAFGTARPSASRPAATGSAAFGNLGRGQRAQQPQQIGDALGVAGRPAGRQVLQLPAGGGDDLGVEQLAQLDPAEQFSEQGGIQRQGLRRGARPAGCRPRT